MSAPVPVRLPHPALRLPAITVQPEPVARWQAELDEPIRNVAWLADHSAVLVLTTSGRLLRLNAATGRSEWPYATAGTGLVCCLDLCPGAPILATGGLDGQLSLRNAHTGKIVSTQRLGRGWVERVGWSPDGQLLAAVCGPVLHVLNALGCRLGSFAHPGTTITGLSWLDSARLATSSATTVRVFPVAGGAGALEPYHVLETGRPVLGLTGTARGGLAAGAPDGAVWCWPPSAAGNSRAPAGSLKKPVEQLSWQASGQWLASAHGTQVVVWPVDTAGLGRRLLRLRPHGAAVCGLAYQARGPLLASADAAGNLALWHPLHLQDPVFTHSLGSAATALCWMPNDCCLAVGTAAGRVLVMSVQGRD